MSLYFRFPRPDGADFFAAKSGYVKLLVPPVGHPTEKNCYAIIDTDHLETFLEDFGDLGEIILEHEMPDIARDSKCGQHPVFRIVIPRD